MYPRNYSESLHKRLCRDFLFDEVTERFNQKQLLRICTLPHTNYELEKRLLEHFPNAQLSLIEHDLNTFNTIALYWAGTPTKVLYGDVFRHLYTKEQYELIYLDLCSPLSVPLIENMKFILSTQRKCVIAFSIVRGREHYSKRLTDFYKVLTLEKLRVKLPSMLTQDTSYSLVFSYTYKNNSNAVPMQTFVFAPTEGAFLNKKMYVKCKMKEMG